jgi:hypothetical protein
MRMMEGVNSTMIYLLYCKNFCKCHTTIKKKKVQASLGYIVYIVRLCLKKKFFFSHEDPQRTLSKTTYPSQV